MNTIGMPKWFNRETVYANLRLIKKWCSKAVGSKLNHVTGKFRQTTEGKSEKRCDSVKTIGSRTNPEPEKARPSGSGRGSVKSGVAKGNAGIQLLDTHGQAKSSPFRARIVKISENGVSLAVKSDMQDAIYMLKGEAVTVVVDAETVSFGRDVLLRGAITGVQKRNKGVFVLSVKNKAANRELSELVRRLRVSKRPEQSGGDYGHGALPASKAILNRPVDDTILGQLCLNDPFN